MANTVVGGIRNSVAVGGAVRATVKHAIAHSGIASLRWNTNAISYLLDNPRREPDCAPYSECDARCSASHCSLIQPRLAEFTPSGTRILGMMTTAINAMTMPTMNSIWSSPLSRRTTILTGGTVTVCALVHSASGTRNVGAILRDVEGAARSATGRAGLPRADFPRLACAFENSSVQR